MKRAVPITFDPTISLAEISKAIAAIDCELKADTRTGGLIVVPKTSKSSQVPAYLRRQAE